MVRELGEDSSIARICGDPYAACADVDAAVIATEWPEFAELDLSALRRLMRGDLLFDGRTVVDPEAVSAAGLRYRAIGMLPTSAELPHIRLAV
jgi:UDPglucose 6-dehydrogenase